MDRWIVFPDEYSVGDYQEMESTDAEDLSHDEGNDSSYGEESSQVEGDVNSDGGDVSEGDFVWLKV